MKKLLLIVSFFLLLAVAALVLFNSFLGLSYQKKIQFQPAPADSTALLRLSRALRFQTVYGTDSFAKSQLAGFQLFIKEAFPNVHKLPSISRLNLSEGCLLYKWEGKDRNQAPSLWVAAQDVPEPDLATIPSWKYNPFEGRIADGRTYGAGAYGAKLAFLAALEAWERLSKQGFQPQNDLYLLAPHDAHATQSNSLALAAAVLQQSNVQLRFSLVADNFISAGQGLLAGKNLAWVGICQKNKSQIRLHSPDSVALIDFYNQLNNKILRWDLSEKSQLATVDFLAPELDFADKALFSNPWLFAYFINKKLQADSFLLRNARIEPQTLAFSYPDSNQKGFKSDILLHLPQSVGLEKQLSQWRADFGGDSLQVVEKQLFANYANPQSWEWGLIEKACKQHFENTLLIPTAASRYPQAGYLQKLSRQQFYFCPLLIESEQIGNFLRGIDEQIKSENYHKMIAFYQTIAQAS